MAEEHPKSLWLYVRCKRCSEDLPFEEVSPAPAPDDPLSHAPVRVKCTRCGLEAEYTGRDMQWAQVGQEDR